MRSGVCGEDWDNHLYVWSNWLTFLSCFFCRHFRGLVTSSSSCMKKRESCDHVKAGLGPRMMDRTKNLWSTTTELTRKNGLKEADSRSLRDSDLLVLYLAHSFENMRFSTTSCVSDSWYIICLKNKFLIMQKQLFFSNSSGNLRSEIEFYTSCWSRVPSGPNQGDPFVISFWLQVHVNLVGCRQSSAVVYPGV